MLLQTLQCSNLDVISAVEPGDSEKSELQEPQVEQKQEEDVSGAESALSEAESDAVGLKNSWKNVRWKVEEFIAVRLSAILALKFCRPIRNLASLIFSYT